VEPLLRKRLENGRFRSLCEFYCLGRDFGGHNQLSYSSDQPTDEADFDFGDIDFRIVSASRPHSLR
jgi:hypothetical protein